MSSDARQIRRKPTFNIPEFEIDEPQMEIVERLVEGENEPNLVHNRRRHTVIHKAESDGIGLLPSFNNKPKGRERRHSLMPPSEALRRLSVDITEAQREALKLPRFSQVFGFSTFSGLPMMGYHDPVLSYENTYKMTPDRRFQGHIARPVVEKVIDDLLYWDDDVLTDDGKRPEDEEERKKYEAAKHKRRSELIKKMVEEVKDEMKELNFSRYKYIVNAMIGEIKGQGLEVASRCLWDTNTDNCLCVHRKGRDCYVVVLVHAIYFE